MTATADDYKRIAQLAQSLHEHYRNLADDTEALNRSQKAVAWGHDRIGELEGQLKDQLIKAGLVPQTLSSRLAAKVTGEFPEDPVLMVTAESRREAMQKLSVEQ